MRRQFIGFCLAILVVCAVTFGVALPEASAICAAPNPDVSMQVHDVPPDCAAISAYGEGGDGYLEVVNECEVEVRVERVNCSECSNDVVAAIPGESDRRPIPIGYGGQPADSDFRWVTADESGTITVSAQMPETGPCNDTRIIEQSDPGCSMTGSSRGAVPISFALLVLFGVGLVARRK